jgi:DNA-directed RNA polymerase specialized sigma24 family protein
MSTAADGEFSRQRVASLIAVLLHRDPTTRALPPAFWTDVTLQRMVARALARMAPDQRQSFLLFEVEGLPATFRRLYQAQRVVRETLGVDRN